MRTKAVVSTLIALSLLCTGTNVAQAGEPFYQKDFFQKGSYQKGYTANKHEHCCKHCSEDRGTRGANNPPEFFARAPVGAVVDSVPVTRAVPSLVSVPMMAGVPVSRAATTSCEADDERIDELDARVEALHLRMVTIQRSIELQTQILEELRDKGTIGGTPLRRLP
jgi:hypothetical protein